MAHDLFIYLFICYVFFCNYDFMLLKDVCYK